MEIQSLDCVSPSLSNQHTPFGVLPMEIKLGYKVKQRMLTGLKNFIGGTGVRFGILVNNTGRIEFLTDTIMQIQARYF